MTNYETGIVKCGYCGNYHTYSAEMCKDMITRPAPGMFTTIYAPCNECPYRKAALAVNERSTP